MAITASYTGFVNGDTPDSLNVLPELITTSSSHVGSYPVTLSSAEATDYIIDRMDGVLAVTPALLRVIAIR